FSISSCSPYLGVTSCPTRRSSDLTVTAFFLWQVCVSLLGLVVLALSVHSSLPSVSEPVRFSKASLQGTWRFAAGMLGISLLSLLDRKSTRLNSSHVKISYSVFCLK